MKLERWKQGSTFRVYVGRLARARALNVNGGVGKVRRVSRQDGTFRHSEALTYLAVAACPSWQDDAESSLSLSSFASPAGGCAAAWPLSPVPSGSAMSLYIGRVPESAPHANAATRRTPVGIAAARPRKRRRADYWPRAARGYPLAIRAAQHERHGRPTHGDGDARHPVEAGRAAPTSRSPRQRYVRVRDRRRRHPRRHLARRRRTDAPPARPPFVPLPSSTGDRASSPLRWSVTAREILNGGSKWKWGKIEDKYVIERRGTQIDRILIHLAAISIGTS